MCNCGRGATTSRRNTPSVYRGAYGRRNLASLIPFPQSQNPSQEQADNPPVVYAPAPSNPEGQQDENKLNDNTV